MGPGQVIAEWWTPLVMGRQAGKGYVIELPISRPFMQLFVIFEKILFWQVILRPAGTGFLPHPKVVCACGFAFPLADHYRAVLAWALSSAAIGALGSEGLTCQRFMGKLLLPREFCYHNIAKKESASRTETLGISPGQIGPKTVLGWGGQGRRLTSDHKLAGPLWKAVRRGSDEVTIKERT